MENLRLGGLGMKHTKMKTCIVCNETKPETEEYFYWRTDTESFRNDCGDCERIRSEKNNRDQMRVNGKYISRKHPLYKPGTYKTFEDAAFSSLSKYEATKEGQVYIITNKAWKGWIKIGMAIDSEDRCNQYQTSSPFRDYELKYKKYFNNRRTAESIAHSLCEEQAKDRSGEWFKLPIQTAIKIIESITEEQHEKETA